MKYLLILLQFFSLEKALSQDTSSLNAKANIAILQSIKKQPSDVKIKFFINGKEKTKGYKSFVVCNGVSLLESKSKVLKLNLKELKDEDSIFFSLKYKGQTISSKNYKAKDFLHGGQYVVGISTDFSSEKIKYLMDTTSYMLNNTKNYLYYFIKKENNQPSKNLLIYSVVKNNVNSWADYKYEFKLK